MSNMRVPLFPLDAVLFPGGTILLQIFEQRYIQMVKYCTQNESGFGICMLDKHNNNNKEPDIFNIGTYAHIYDFEHLNNGLLGLYCRGDRRFKVQYDGSDKDNLHYGIIQWLPEQTCEQLPAVMQPCVDYLRQFIAKHSLPMSLEAHDLGDPHWVSCRLAELLPLTNRSKQTILEMDEAELRMNTLYAVIQTLNQGSMPS